MSGRSVGRGGQIRNPPGASVASRPPGVIAPMGSAVGWRGCLDIPLEGGMSVELPGRPWSGSCLDRADLQANHAGHPRGREEHLP
jgi:hypothetical protein